MRRFQAILGLLALTALGAQTLRHAYVLLVEPRGSVLDKYEPGKEDVMSAKSLDELLGLYESARQKIAAAKARNPIRPDESAYNYEDRLGESEEAFRAENVIESAIREWESHHGALYELHFFFLAGAAVAVLGALVYLRMQTWAGTCLCILGTLEMIWATSPSFAVFGSPPEFDRLLTFKLVYSIVALLLVLIGWRIASRSETRGVTPPAGS